jgi:hypothetical protein
MPAAIITRCPGCNARIKAPYQLLGQRRMCPGCGTPFVVRVHVPADTGPVLAPADRPAPVGTGGYARPY